MTTFVELVPGHLRGADQPLGAPLAAFLGALEAELGALRGAIGGLLDDRFVERASAEALPLLAELLGARLFGLEPGAQRAALARAVAWRRRRGTLATLEEVLSETTRWPAEVDEGFRSLMFTQDLRRPTIDRGRLPAMWDPLPLADPLSRRAPRGDTRRGDRLAQDDLVTRAAGESPEDTLRRLGRADAGRYAVSPRLFDPALSSGLGAPPRGWARPEGVLVRTSRLVAMQLLGIAVAPALVHTRADGRRVFTADPLGRGTAMLWPKPLERPDLIPTLTARHEPDDDPLPPARRATVLLTPTALAGDPDAVEQSGAFALAVDGVPVVGPPALDPGDGPALAEPMSPVFRLADPARAGGGRWRFTLVAAGGGQRVTLATVEHGGGATGTPVLTAAAALERAGATLELEVERVAGAGSHRTGTSWAPLALGPEDHGPLSAAAAESGGQVLRLEAGPRLVVLGDGGFVPLAVTGELPDGPGFAALGDTGSVLLAGPVGELLGVWRATLDPATIARVDRAVEGADDLHPGARTGVALAMHGGRLYVFGGAQGEDSLDELWSIDPATSPAGWTFHGVRPLRATSLPARHEATLLSAFGGLVLLGGSEEPGALERAVFWTDPSSSRPVWHPLAELPAGPGVVVAHALGGGIEALVWGDATRPRRCFLADREGVWTLAPGPEEGPNPPAWGTAAFLPDDSLVVVGSPPLPPSELVARTGGRSRLFMLPAIDVRAGETWTFALRDDGGTDRLFAPGETAAFPRGPYAAPTSVRADTGRMGVAGRLSRQPYRLRQWLIGDADGPLGPAPDDLVGLDPRSARAVLPATLAGDSLTVSFWVGRGSPLGAGFLPPDRRLPPFWEEPDRPAPTPPDGEVTSSLLPLEDALAASRAARHPLISVVGSPRLQPTRLSAARGFSIAAADFGAAPLVAWPDDPDLAALTISADLPPLPSEGRAPDPLDGVWLAGLWIAARTDLVLARGFVDLRWCTLGDPGEVGLAAAGGQHEPLLGRRSLHETQLEIRLYGCQVGAVELPPWVTLIAAGCLFDAGNFNDDAIRAAGARVRLRHCTVRGGVSAGELQASSSVFGGSVRVDRPDLGWVRYSLLRHAGGQPRRHFCPDHAPSFASLRPTDPTYLVLGDNNGPGPLGAGEGGRTPGAHGERSDRARALDFRTAESLPIGLGAAQFDRVAYDLGLMARRTS